MSRIKKTSPLLNLSNFQTFIVDDNPLSQYFKISELGDLFTAGKNGFLIEGSTFLKPSTEIKIEVLDTEGNPLFVEPGEGIPEYYEGLSKLIGVYVYEDTPIGIGKITILGELDTWLDENGFPQPIPEDWAGIYNIKWERDIKINKNIPNETRVRFVRRPEVIIEELNESFYSRNLVNATQTDGLVRGIALTPTEGTTLRGYRGGIRYLVQKESGTFLDGGTFISVTGTNIQNAEVVEYLNDSSVVVATPFTSSDGLISNFSGKNYSLSYQYNQNPVASSILGSFGRFEINQLQTFVGDVERIKVFKKSRASNVDYEVIQDTRVESSEILTAIVSGSAIDVGHFSSSYENGQSWNAFWVTQSNAGNILDSSKIYRAVKLQNNRLSTNLGDDIRLESGSEYALEFYNYYDTSSNDTTDTLKVYLTSTLRSGSGIANYYLTQSLTTFTGSNEFRSANKRSFNFIPPVTDNWTINFEATNTTENSYWHVGSVSLKAAHELGFSPDEFNFIIPIDRDLERETFDFKFEFFDINNNYVPITVTTAKTFQSGNIGLIDKNIIVDTDKDFFNFSSSLEASPPHQIINIVGTKNRILGNLLITSQAFDTGGIAIPAATFSNAGYEYPGRFTSSYEDVYSFSASLHVEDFSGSLHPTTIVDRITYTLTEVESIQPFIKRFTINRLVAGATGENGTDARILTVSANTNQFVYEPTGPGLKPSGQIILIDVRKQNLVSGSTAIQGFYTQSTVGAPTLTQVGSETNGVITYRLLGSSFPFSTGEVIYAFTGSDEFDNLYADSVKITPVMNFDGVSVVLTNESSTFPVKSTGDIIQTSDLALGSGSVLVNINSASIQYTASTNLGANRFTILSQTASGVTANAISATSASYSISGFPNTADSGSLELAIRYRAGDNTTNVDFRKFVTYTKAKKAAPVLEFVIGNNNQSVDAKSTGVQITQFATCSLFVKEQYNGSATILPGLSITSVKSGSVVYPGVTFTSTQLNLPTMSSAVDSVELSVTGSINDSEGVSRTVFGNVSLTKLKKTVPNVEVSVSPPAQSVTANSDGSSPATPTSLTVKALEGGTTRLTSVSAVGTSVTVGTITYNGSSPYNYATIPLSAVAADNASVLITVNYTDSEGTAGTKTITATISKAKTGAKGDTGDSGTNGLRTATGMVHFQTASVTAPSNPTATSYTFSNGTFSGLTENWGTGAPTYASGNTNKYWYSFFTAVETSPGSGVGNVTFGNSTQAIGFSGLVSFTTAEGVSDGTNNLTFGVAGTTLINGSNISTGKITSTNISLPGGFNYANGQYVNAGMLINLDSGSIHAKNFFISSSGDAEFRGNLAVTTKLGGSSFGTLALSSSVSATTQVSGLGVLAVRDTVAATHIDAGAVTEAKIGSGAVSNAKIAADAVTEAKIATDAVTSGKISANAVVADKIAANAIVADKIAANAVTAGKIIAGAVEADKIATNAVTADKILANTIEASKISSLNFYGKTAKFDTGDIGGWIINTDKLSSPPDGSGYSRLQLNPSPLIAVNDTSGNPKLTIRAGNLTQLGAAGSLSLAFNTINFNSFSDSYSQIQSTIYSPSYLTINVANAGTYSGTFSMGATGTLATTPSPWFGYLYIGLGYQIATDTSFNNVVSYGIIGSSGIGSAGSVSIGLTNTEVSITFASTGNHYVRLYWQRILYSSVTAQTTFYANSSGVSAASLGQSVEVTELTDKGMQIINTTTRYIRIAREGDYTTVPFVVVGGNFAATGNVIAYYSDKRLKDIEGNIPNPLEKIEKINGVYYTQNKLAEEFGYNNYKRQVGLIAQEVEEVLPEVVQQAAFDINTEDGTSKTGENYLSIDYDKVVPLLVECIKELKKEVEELKKSK